MRSPWAAALIDWLALAACAFANGLLREGVLIPMLGEGAARPLSALVLSLVVLVIARVLSRRAGPLGQRAWGVGVLWVLLTILFEAGLGTMRGLSGADILASYSPLAPTLWLYVVLVILVAPPLMDRSGR